jgi:hypothetical protein
VVGDAVFEECRPVQPGYSGWIMVCLSWWWFVAALVGATVIGCVGYFAWQWWLLSRPDARPSA